MKLYARLLLATTVATFFLIFVGSLVRVSGAGLGCPDWPHCFGQWWPPTSQAQLHDLIASGVAGPADHSGKGIDLDPSKFNVTLAWIEYLNRLVGVVLGIMVIAVSAGALLLKEARQDKPLLIAAVSALPLVLINGYLGALVVRSELSPVLVTIHMGFALLMASVMIYASLRAHKAFDSGEAPIRGGLPRFVLVVWLLTIVQICVGADLRGQVDMLLAAIPTLSGPALLQSIGPVKHLHMVLGLAVAGVSYGLALRIQRRRLQVRPTALYIARMQMILTLVQVCIGFAFGTIGMMPLLKIFHLWNSSLIIGLWVVLYVALRRPAPAAAIKAAERAVADSAAEDAQLAGLPAAALPHADDDEANAGLNFARWVSAGAFLVCVMAGVAIITVQQAKASQAVLPIFDSVPNFELYSTDGTVFTRQRLMGHVTVVNFMFTSCLAVCPIQTARIAELHRAFADEPNLQFLSITVDPETDTVDALRAYAEGFHSDERWHWVRGPLDATKTLAADGFTLRSDFPNHSPKLILVDREGRIRNYYDSLTPEPAVQLANDIRTLLKQ